MSRFTYENKDNCTPLETFEWESLWLEKTENQTSKRVLYIGDSISCAARHKATTLSRDEVLFDGFGTSKSIDNPFFTDSLLTFMKQQNSCDAIVFNNGLHGWHLSNEQYKKFYREMIEFIRANNSAPLVLLLTTDVSHDADRSKRVVERNQVVCELADEYNLPIIDFYAVSKEIEDTHDDDGVHFNDKGNTVLAQYLLDNIKKYF